MYLQNVIHRNVNPETLLIHNGSIKLANFGFAKIIDENMEEP